MCLQVQGLDQDSALLLFLLHERSKGPLSHWASLLSHLTLSDPSLPDSEGSEIRPSLWWADEDLQVSVYNPNNPDNPNNSSNSNNSDDSN